MSILGILSWIVFGLVVGAIARFVLPGRQNMSLLMTCVLGMVGSFVGGALAHLFVGSGEGFFQPAGWIMSIIGAVIALLIYMRVAQKA